jgi:hypothetical protein
LASEQVLREIRGGFEISWNHFISEKYNHLGCSSLERVPLCNDTRLPATANVLETFLEAILWKPCLLFGRILMSVASQKRRLFNADFSQGSRWKWAWTRSGEYGGCSSAVTLFFAKKCLTKTDRCAGALSCRRNQLLVLHFSGRFVLTASLSRRRMSMYISLFTATHSCKLYQRIPGTFRSYYVSCLPRLDINPGFSSPYPSHRTDYTAP